MSTRREVRQVCEAVVYAYEHDALSAAQVLSSLGQDPRERELMMFTALLAVVARSAELLGMSPTEYARQLIAYYG